MAADQLDLDAIKARAEAATPGPWEFQPFIHGDPLICEAGRGGFGAIAMANTGKEEYGRLNALHIAGMDPQTTLALVAEVERLREKVSPRPTHPAQPIGGTEMGSHYIWVKCRVDGCTAHGEIYTGGEILDDFSDNQWEGETIVAACKEHEGES